MSGVKAMAEINFSDMRGMQLELRRAHEEKWGPLDPKAAPNQLLWLVEELGEAISIVKKKSEKEIMAEGAVRYNLCAELCDVLMYFNDVLICYGITPEEISNAYIAKHQYNMKRDYYKQNKALYCEKEQ